MCETVRPELTCADAHAIKCGMLKSRDAGDLFERDVLRRLIESCAKALAERESNQQPPPGTYAWAEGRPDGTEVRRRSWNGCPWLSKWLQVSDRWRGWNCFTRTWEPVAPNKSDREATDWEIVPQEISLGEAKQIALDVAAEHRPPGRVEVPVEWQLNALMFPHPGDRGIVCHLRDIQCIKGWRFLGARHKRPNGTWTGLMRVLGVWCSHNGNVCTTERTHLCCQLVDGTESDMTLVFERMTNDR
jgi:hypothetical protein